MATDQDVHDLNLLAAHLEGRLTEQESVSLLEHLSGCEPCRRALAAYSRATAVTAVRASGVRLSRAWLPIAAMLALATTAAVVSVRLGPRTAAPPSVARAAAPPSAPPSTPSSAPAEPQPRPPVASGAASERPSQTRAGTRTIAGKTFRLEAGVWIDAAYDPLALLPADDAPTTDARASLLARVPALVPFAALGDNVIVVHGGAVYRIGPLSVARQ